MSILVQLSRAPRAAAHRSGGLSCRTARSLPWLALLLALVGCSTVDNPDGSTDTGHDLGPSGGPDLGPADLGPEQPTDGGGGDADQGPGGFDLGPLHDLTELTIHGRVTVDFAAAGPRVEVSASCGETTVQVLTDDAGDFELTADVRTCNQLVVQFRKESYLPTLRVVHLPPPASPVTMNVMMTALKELQCGSEHCVVEGDPISRFPPGPMTRGWVAVLGGPNAVNYLGGEFRNTQGEPIWVTGFGYFDLRDDSGATLSTFPAFTECFGVSYDSLDQIVDLIPATDHLEMELFTLDEPSGRWNSLGPEAWVGITTDTTGLTPVISPATRAQKDDIRSNQLLKQVWICTEVSASGWLAWGVSIAPRTCVSLSVVNQCGRPLPNVIFELRGRWYGYLASTWTDRLGRACLETNRSESIGLDLNANELAGETFWVNGQLSWGSGQVSFPSLQMPSVEGSCAEIESCMTLRHAFQDFTAPSNCRY